MIEKEHCGETKDLMYDDKVKKLNLELATDKNGSPVIIFQDWTDEENSKELFRIHIKEAMEIKSIMDNLVIDYVENKYDFLIQANNLKEE